MPPPFCAARCRTMVRTVQARTYNCNFLPPPWKPTASTSSRATSRTSPPERRSSGGIFDYDAKKSRLIEVVRALEDPRVWDDAKKAQDLGKERRALEETLSTIEKIDAGLSDSGELFSLARGESDEATLEGV